MSHKTSALTPWITSITPLEFSAGAGKTLTIKGFGLSPTSDVDLGNLGTETGRSYTATDGTGDGTLVITFTCAANATAMKNVSIGTGGVQAVGPACPSGSVSVYHGINPSDISDLVLWLDSNDPSTITHSGNVVSSWIDKANSVAFTNSTESERPVYVSSGGILGRGHITPGGDSQKLLSNVGDIGRTAGNISTASYQTTFFVFSAPSTSTAGTAGIWYANPSVPGSATLFAYKEGLVAYAEGGWTVEPTDGAALSTDTKYLGMVRRGSGGIQHYLNGTLDYQGSNVLPADYFDGGEHLKLWFKSASGSSRKGEFGEIITYKRELTDTEVDQIESYLNTKWSIY